MTAFKTTKERRANLVKLARFLFTEPIEAIQFDMDWYYSDASIWDEPVAKRLTLGCGTAGCAIGWGPAAGVTPIADEEIGDYAERAFIECPRDEDPAEAWWCFASDWGCVDNTPQGAAKRILWLLLNGLPCDSVRQMQGKEPLCYADWQPTESDWQAAERGGA